MAFPNFLIISCPGADIELNLTILGGNEDSPGCYGSVSPDLLPKVHQRKCLSHFVQNTGFRDQAASGRVGLTRISSTNCRRRNWSRNQLEGKIQMISGGKSVVISCVRIDSCRCCCFCLTAVLLYMRLGYVVSLYTSEVQLFRPWNTELIKKGTPATHMK